MKKWMYIAAFAVLAASCASVPASAPVAEVSKPAVAEVPKPPAAEVPKPAVAEVPKPAVAEVPKPAVAEAPKPAVAEAPKPAVAEAPKPAVAEAPKPAVAEAPKPAVAEAPKPAVAVAEPLPVKKVPKKVTVRIPVERKSSIRFADGSLDEYLLSEYESNTLKAQTRYSASGSMLERTRFDTANGRLVSKATADGEGKPVSSRTYAYGANGLVASEILVDGKGAVLSTFEYGYDNAGHRITWTVKDSRGSVLAETSYVFRDGKTRTAELKDGSGRKNGSSAYDYDAEGHLTKQSFFDAKGSLVRAEVTRWSAGRISVEERTNSGGTVLQRTSYEYGSEGELIRKTIEDFVGKSRQSTEFEYDFREEIREISE